MDIPIALCLNKAFINPACVVMYSTLKNSNPLTRYKFFLISRDIDDSDLQLINQRLAKFQAVFTCEIKFISDEQYASIPSTLYYSKEACFRVFIPLLLQEYDKLIYLDCDVLVCQDLTQLYQVELQEKAYAACSEKPIYKLVWNPLITNRMKEKYKFFEKMDFDILDDNSHYVNSGVMLINNNYWQNNNYCYRILEFIKQHSCDKNFNCPDQDAINFVNRQDGKNKFLKLNLKFNLFSEFFIEKVDVNNPKFRELLKMLNINIDKNNIFSPVIIHFATNPKPWDKSNKSIFCEDYRKYANEIGWKIDRHSVKRKFNIKKIIKLLTPHGLIVWKNNNFKIR
ncbi:MAG: glycosyltransferase family 8 protein [Firmicutes bacterium]|nr:glycosyltransferase family 8 protein [Bacillota bacterium]MCL1953624.1 glycosyltransferase family 8 protein [Bacillota bacterium]